MKKFLFTVSSIISLQFASAQTNPTVTLNDSTRITISENPQPKEFKKFDLSNRSNDHLLIQFGADGWSGTPDSINKTGFSRHFNVYLMLDKPFKTNPKYSVGLGVGLGTSNIFFSKTFVDIKSTGATLPFTRVDSSNHFKKFKLTTAYVEAPVELRYSSNPLENNKSLKVAVGVKVGMLINAHTKGKLLEDKNEKTVNSYTSKENSKKFFNSTRFAATARIGYGIISVHGAYQILALLKDGTGPVIHPYSVGITISGL
ncbi:MAG: PorT family protein [Segetibacter sp.]|nr:PorT family protein [Segetibacter sp.]